MTLSPADMLGKVAIGNDAGWALTFHHETEGRGLIEEPVLTIGSGDYYASIEAALPEGFGPGKYTFRIEGIDTSATTRTSRASSRRRSCGCTCSGATRTRAWPAT